MSSPSLVRSDGLCVQYKGFSPGCVTGTVWSTGGALSTASALMGSSAGVSGSSSTGAATDSDAEMERRACPHVVQKRSPSTALLPQFTQNIGRFLVLAMPVRSGELRMIHSE